MARVEITDRQQLLPEGWRWVRFDEMAESVTDRVDDPSQSGVEYYVGLEHLDADSLRIRRWGTPDDVTATKLRFAPGDIIFGRRRAYQRKVAVAAFEGICSAHALVLRAREEVVEKDFLPFFMQSEVFFDRALSISVGSLSPTINWPSLARQEFALPPKPEQHRIAASLLLSLEVLTGIERALRTANEAGSALAAALITPKETQPLIANPGNRTELASPLGEGSVVWTSAPIGEAFLLRSGSTPSRSNPAFFRGGTIPWVKTLDLNEGVVERTEECITEEALDQTSCKMLPPGTVMVAMYGGWQQIGRTGLLSIPAATNQAICSLEPNGGPVLPKFALRSLQLGRPRWRRIAASSRKDPNISKRDVHEFVIAFPESKEEQRKICEAISIADQACLKVQLHRTKHAALHRQLLEHFVQPNLPSWARNV